MTKSHFLDDYTHKIDTEIGGVLPGQRAIFRGKDIHHGIDALQMKWMGQLLFGVTGREYPLVEVAMLDAMFFISQYPDSRIWCNRVAALAGTTKSTPSLAVGAATAVGEATIYGRRNEIRAYSFFKRTGELLQQGCSLGECLDYQLKHHKIFPGYGRPLANADERIKPFLDYADKLGIKIGYYVNLAFSIDQEILKRGLNLRMNYGALVSAYAADMGLSELEFTSLYPIAFYSGSVPCYMEACQKPALALYPLKKSDITYTGPQKRTIP